jgi:hypothetical protein
MAATRSGSNRYQRLIYVLKNADRVAGFGNADPRASVSSPFCFDKKANGIPESGCPSQFTQNIGLMKSSTPTYLKSVAEKRQIMWIILLVGKETIASGLDERCDNLLKKIVGRKLERRFVWDKRYVVIGIWTSSEIRFSVRCGVDAQTSHRDLRITEVSTESAKVTLPSSSGIIRGARLAAILLRIARCLRHADKVPARF